MKTRRLSLAALAVVAVALATGCNSIYQPRVVDIPLINHQGDQRLDAALGLTAYGNPAFGVTYSRGFTDHLAGQAHLGGGAGHGYLQLAPGLYTTVGENFVLEGYAGLGVASYNVGRTYETDAFDTSFHYYFTYAGKYAMPFVQGNFGWNGLLKGHFDVAFSLKTGYYIPTFDYQQFLPDDTPIEGRSQQYTTPNVVLEPQLQIRIGGERVKYCFRVGVCWLSDMKQNPNSYLVSDFMTLSNGLTFSF